MNILNHFQHLILTDDQFNALQKIDIFLQGNDDVFILEGYAGSGKTTLLKGLVEYLQSIQKEYQLMAPTGRAAKVINQKTGFESTTIHKGIYSFDELLEIKKTDEEDNVSFLYQYTIRNNVNIHNSVLLVDEASMVSDVLSEGEFFRFGSGYLLKDLITYSHIQDPGNNTKIIFIGDPAQLPPIGMAFSPALDSKYLKSEYHLKVQLAEMKEVKRQDKENGILQAATKIRKSLTSGFFYDFDLRENRKDIFTPPYEDFLETYKDQKGKKVIISFKNKTALDLNLTIRKDKFGAELPIQSTDIVIIGGNNYRLGIMNGDFAVVSNVSSLTEERNIKFYTKGGKVQNVNLKWRSIELLMADEKGKTKTVSGLMLENYLSGENYLKSEEQRALYVDFRKRHPKLKTGTEEFKEAISNDKYFNCILLKYGYAVTCHKAQGGEWDSAFVFWDKGTKQEFNFLESEHDRIGKTNSDFYRWAYTAVTRASRKLFCINPPFFNSFSNMAFVPVKVQEAYNELTDKSNLTEEIDFNEEIVSELQKFNLTDAPLTIQDHFIFRWHHLRKHYIDIVGWEKVGYEIRYLFKRGEEIAAFKYWINGKNEFRSKFQKIPSRTNSDELFDRISAILDKSYDLVVNRAFSEGIFTQMEFDIEIEESKPFLKNLYDSISENLMIDEHITDVIHLSFRERYTIKKADSYCVFDFEYNNNGFFGRVLPLEKKCNSSELLNSMERIVTNLKKGKYVV